MSGGLTVNAEGTGILRDSEMFEIANIDCTCFHALYIQGMVTAFVVLDGTTLIGNSMSSTEEILLQEKPCIHIYDSHIHLLR